MSVTTTRRRSWQMVGAACGCVFVILAVTAGAIAVLPDVATDLDAAQSELQWIGDGFPLLIAALLVPGAMRREPVDHRRRDDARADRVDADALSQRSPAQPPSGARTMP